MKRLPLFAVLFILLGIAMPFLLPAAKSVNWTQPTPPVIHQSISTNATTNGAITAVLPAAAGRMTYVEGFDVTYAGATSAASFKVTITGTTNTLNYSNVVLAGATAAGNAQGGIFIRFPSPIPASATNSTITLTVPDLGSGNANVSATIYGFQS